MLRNLADERNPAIGRGDVVGESSEAREHCIAADQHCHGPKQRSDAPFLTRPNSRGGSQQYAKNGANPPTRREAPDESQHSGIARPNDLRMPDREIFDADPGRDLVVDDAVSDAGQNRENDDGEPLHHGDRCANLSEQAVPIRDGLRRRIF